MSSSQFAIISELSAHNMFDKNMGQMVSSRRKQCTTTSHIPRSSTIANFSTTQHHCQIRPCRSVFEMAPQTTPLLRIPAELIFHVSLFLHVPDLLNLRKTCRLLSHLTRDKALWLDQLRLQQLCLPLPRDARETNTAVNLRCDNLERVVVDAQRAERQWPLQRSDTLQLSGIPAEITCQDILYLTVLLDRWVLCVYSNGSMVLWDALSEGGKVQGRIISPPSYWVLWGRESWTSAIACLDGNEDAVYVAITGTQNRETPGSITVLMRIPLDANAPCSEECPQSTNDSYKSDQSYFAAHDLQFNDVDTFFGADGQNIRAIEPSKQLIAYTRGMYIDILHWPSNTGVTIDTHTNIDDLEQLWNGMIGLQFVGSHILCVKARTVELYPVPYPLPAQSSYFVPSTLGPICRPDSPMARVGARRSCLQIPTTNVAKHAFPGTNFRGVSIASPSYSTRNAKEGPTPMALSFLAHDVLRGVYHYHVQITPAATSSSAPTMRVELVGLQDMSKGAPGFISAAALGPQGRRGAWIERTKNATSRRVSVFSANPLRPVFRADVPLSQPVTIETRPRAPSMAVSSGSTSSDASDSDDDPEDALVGGPVGGAPMDAHVVYEVKSYDLREDLTFIAFSEVSGRIVLGTRFGAIRVI